MNTIITGYTGGMPVNENTFKTLQATSYEVLTAFIGHMGIDINATGKYILYGCEVVGSNITKGMLYIDYEVVYFEGAVGNASTKIGVSTAETAGYYKNGTPRTLTRTTTAIVSPTGTPLSGFTRIPKVQDLVNQATAWNDITNKPAVVIDPANLTLTPPEKTILERIAKLERQNAVFIAGGGMVLWNKPANEIPADWQEVVNWKGRMPVGVNDQLNAVGQFVDPEFAPYPNPADSNSLTVAGRTGGKKTHQLTKAELPNYNLERGVGEETPNGGPEHIWSSGPGNSHTQIINSGGGDQPHPILNPFRTVYFIEYIGL